MLNTIWNQRELVYQLTKRDVLMRYRGSLLGIFWSLLTPLFMLTIYALVFGMVFKPRWDAPAQSQWEFVLILFCGLSIFGIFAEVVSRSPGLILGNPNYVKRVVFPVEILPITLIGSALIHGSISLLILILTSVVLTGHLYMTALFLPLIILPLILFALGLSWFLASIGVYFRDINQVIPIFISALMFLSPVFYPISAIPEKARFFFYLNPISYVVEDARQILLWGNYPNWTWLAVGTGLGVFVALIGHGWFDHTKKGFADVI